MAHRSTHEVLRLLLWVTERHKDPRARKHVQSAIVQADTAVGGLALAERQAALSRRIRERGRRREGVRYRGDRIKGRGRVDKLSGSQLPPRTRATTWRIEGVARL